MKIEISFNFEEHERWLIYYLKKLLKAKVAEKIAECATMSHTSPGSTSFPRIDYSDAENFYRSALTDINHLINR